MTVLARVSTFLKAQPCKRFCDGCITASIGESSRWATNDATRHLAKAGRTLGFVRSHDVCNVCGEVRLVIYAL